MVSLVVRDYDEAINFFVGTLGSSWLRIPRFHVYARPSTLAAKSPKGVSLGLYAAAAGLTSGPKRVAIFTH